MFLSQRHVSVFCDRRCKAELKNSRAQNEELRRTLEIMEGQIRVRVSILYRVYFTQNAESFARRFGRSLR